MTYFLEVAGWTITQENSCHQIMGTDGRLISVVHWWHGKRCWIEDDTLPNQEQLVLDGSGVRNHRGWSMRSPEWSHWGIEESQSDSFLRIHGRQTVQTAPKTAKIGLGRVEFYDEEYFLSWFHGVTVSSYSGVILPAKAPSISETYARRVVM